MFEENRDLILNLIADLVHGSDFALRELLGGQWEAIAGARPHVLGREFAEAVERGDVPGVVFREVRRSGRMNVWRKL